MGPAPVLAGLLCALLAPAAWGHAARVAVGEARAVSVTAAFDTGEPMAGAQVGVFSPRAPEDPWLTGLTDPEGRFVFVPDEGGLWTVQVRQAGHGAISHVEVGPEAIAATNPAQGATGAQRLLMAGAIVWGFVGTALYFKRPRAG